MTRKQTWIVGAVLLVLGVIATVMGQTWLWAEMDAVDAAGPSGPGGALLGLEGITTIVGALLTVAGILVLIVVAVRAGRSRTA